MSDPERRYSMVEVDPTSLEVAPPFSDLFPIDPLTLDTIADSMRDSGYDASNPIKIWRGPNLVVDGHTRREAAIRTGVMAAVFYHDFADEDEAFEYAVKSQRNRRNLTDADIARLVMKCDQRRKPGPNSFASHEAKPCRTSERTADLIGTSRVKVEKTRTVLDHAEPEVKEAVLSGKKSINSAYNETQARRRSTDAPKPDRREPKNGGKGYGLALSHGTSPNANAVNSSAPPEAARGPSGDDLQYLESHPIRTLVNQQAFDRDALLMRDLAPHLAAIRERIARDRAFSTMVAGPAQLVLAEAAGVPDPKYWIICPLCNGTGVRDGVCRRCRGFCYVIPKR